MFSFSGGYPSQGGVIFSANTGSDFHANQHHNPAHWGGSILDANPGSVLNAIQQIDIIS